MEVRGRLLGLYYYFYTNSPLTFKVKKLTPSPPQKKKKLLL